ncbi:LysR family transcriptional regulator [Hoeflea sp. AS60]|uniref:LysR family transcriptional regulator n=1 Tax=Hoeflea sp. AS60 TaxID=3135780 RepID=UPI003175C0A0
MRQRRFLPSQSQLLALEAVVRRGSVTAAAEDLHLTQSTVSRLIQSLEAQLGRELFTRQRKKLIPTDAALTYQRDISRALDMIQRASMSLVTNPGGGVLSLAVLPTLATRWLGPRLGGFLGSHPGISVNIATRIEKFSFETEIFDAAIYFGNPDWPGARSFKLFDERVTACASAEFLERNPVSEPADVAALQLLQLETRQTGWDDWFAGQNATFTGATGMLMDQFSMMIQAAISGLGIALLPDYLARTEISENRLVPILKPAVPTSGAYWLIWPGEKDNYAPIIAFRDWLAREVARDRNM